MKRIRFVLVPILSIVALVPGIARAAVTVNIFPVAVVQNSGASVSAFLRVRCDPVGVVTRPLEALLTLSQNNQRIYGEGYPTTIVCDGTTRVYHVRVDAFERLFHRGLAYASAFVLICNNSGSVCRDGQASGNIRLT